jgi:hypothetical protein
MSLQFGHGKQHPFGDFHGTPPETEAMLRILARVDFDQFGARRHPHTTPRQAAQHAAQRSTQVQHLARFGLQLRNHLLRKHRVADAPMRLEFPRLRGINQPISPDAQNGPRLAAEGTGRALANHAPKTVTPGGFDGIGCVMHRAISWADAYRPRRQLMQIGLDRVMLTQSGIDHQPFSEFDQPGRKIWFDRHRHPGTVSACRQGFGGMRNPPRLQA